MAKEEYCKVDERIEIVHDYWIDPDSREIWIHGVDVSSSDGEWDEPGVEFIMANRVIKNLHYLRKQSSRAGVTIHLHTCGGIVSDGFAIYDTRIMEISGEPIYFCETECYNHDHILRLVFPFAQLIWTEDSDSFFIDVKEFYFNEIACKIISLDIR